LNAGIIARCLTHVNRIGEKFECGAVAQMKRSRTVIAMHDERAELPESALSPEFIARYTGGIPNGGVGLLFEGGTCDEWLSQILRLIVSRRFFVKSCTSAYFFAY